MHEQKNEGGCGREGKVTTSSARIEIADSNRKILLACTTGAPTMVPTWPGEEHR